MVLIIAHTLNHILLHRFRKKKYNVIALIGFQNCYNTFGPM